jgi:(4S)-4-hydroxy-5-phosphonooxypentane-2,3-dione isomerase
VFLYELYDDKAAFDAHLKTPHFLSFDARVRDWVERKAVGTWTRTVPA